jgi:hypothetical protein
MNLKAVHIVKLKALRGALREFSVVEFDTINVRYALDQLDAEIENIGVGGVYSGKLVDRMIDNGLLMLRCLESRLKTS